MKCIQLWWSWHIATLPFFVARSSASTFDLKCSDLLQNQLLVISAYRSLFEAKCQDFVISVDLLSDVTKLRIHSNNLAQSVIQELDAPLLTSLSFVSQGFKTRVPMSISTNAFTQLSALDSLAFENITFQDQTLILHLPASIETLEISGTELSDLEIVTTQTPHWRRITLDVSFPSIPTFIRRLKVEKSYKIDGVHLKAGARTILTQAQFESLSDLSKRTDIFTDAIFDPYCNSQSQDSHADDPGSTNKHVVCYEVSQRPESRVASSNAASSNRKTTSSTFSIWILLIVVSCGIIGGLALAAMVVRLSVINATAPLEENFSRSTKLLRSSISESFQSRRGSVQLLEIDANALNLIEAINPNDFWLGELDTCRVVAKKVRIVGDDMNEGNRLFRYLIQLASIKHENIVSMIGHTWRAGACLTIVTEYMEKGSLGIALHDAALEMDNVAKLQMCLDIALALSHLHENDVYVRQFTSRSVLVNGVKTAKISLFHLESSSKEISFSRKTNEFSFGSGEVAWSAPEVVKGEKSIDPFLANMYTLGVIIGEIWTRNTPFKTLIDDMGSTLADLELIRRMRKHEMLAPHEHHPAYTSAPQGIRDVISLCLSVVPHMRPCAKDLVVALQAVKSQL